MDFSTLKWSFGVRVALLVFSTYLLGQLVSSKALFLTQVGMGALVGWQIWQLIKSVKRNEEEVLNFLNSIQYDDLTARYNTDGENPTINRLNQEFNRVLERLRNLRKEKEADFQYMKNIVQHVGIGLLTFDKSGDVQIINTAAKRLLKVHNLHNIKELSSIHESLVDILFRLRTGGRDLLRLNVQGEMMQLAVFAIELNLKGKLFKLVSLQNIHNELEEKEMEAWQNLVRVLTHEIMNSVTPISSLAGTVEDDLKLKMGNTSGQILLSGEDLDDLQLAVATIQKRSEGLIRFVQDFRNLTQVPQPRLAEVLVKPLLEELLMLHKKEIEASNIQVIMRVEDPKMTIHVDKSLIEQVIINLFKNAMQAFDEENTHRIIELKAYRGEKARPIISIKDNGTGIEPEALEKIFIPFFTTKKNGSGIGLSLSRQIMRKHQGTLAVRSQMEEGTEFLLKF
jgi:two-component system, NtrC family, nitrogen regulation sensor histidine kinase NtrY